jgi:hypothetical protein
LPSIFKAHEPVGIQALGTEASTEGFYERVVGWLAWPREVQRHASGVGPQVQVMRDEPRALVDADPSSFGRVAIV